MPRQEDLTAKVNRFCLELSSRMRAVLVDSIRVNNTAITGTFVSLSYTVCYTV